MDMSTKQAEILFISGSPRARTSEALLALLEQGAQEVGAKTRRFVLSKKHIEPCRGCGYCENTGACILADTRAETDSNDDYLELLEALEQADALAIVAPLFFAGPPAQLKALYDRMQPFWSRRYVLNQTPPEKRPAQIFIVGGGGDSHGYEPLVTISKSALAVAGFSLERTHNFIGFRQSSEVAPFPTEEEAAQLAFGELAHLRKAAAKQKEFVQRALTAGSAFARIVGKSKEKLELQAELQQVEEEIAELSAETPPKAVPERSVEQAEPREIVDHVDSGFEALKQAARTAKSTKAEEALAEAKAGYLEETSAGSGESEPNESSAS